MFAEYASRCSEKRVFAELCFSLQPDAHFVSSHSGPVANRCHLVTFPESIWKGKPMVFDWFLVNALRQHMHEFSLWAAVCRSKWVFAVSKLSFSLEKHIFLDALCMLFDKTVCLPRQLIEGHQESDLSELANCGQIIVSLKSRKKIILAAYNNECEELRFLDVRQFHFWRHL